MSKYKTTPQQAYVDGALQSGDLSFRRSKPCIGCGLPLVAYSQAGEREWGMSGMCEPCFDFVTWPSDEEAPAWMSAVEYTDEFLARYNTKEAR